MYWNTHILMEMEKYSSLKMCAHICALKSLVLGATGCGHIHLCFDDFLCCAFLSTAADIPILLYAVVLHISFHVHTISQYDLNLVPAKVILDSFWSQSTVCFIEL